MNNVLYAVLQANIIADSTTNISIIFTFVLSSPIFRWQWRQRTRLYLEGTGINPIPVDLHDQQLSQEQHSRAHVNERLQDQSKYFYPEMQSTQSDM